MNTTHHNTVFEKMSTLRSHCAIIFFVQSALKLEDGDDNSVISQVENLR